MGKVSIGSRANTTSCRGHFKHLEQILRANLAPPLQDFERERNPERVLQSMSLKRFAALIFRECPGLEPFAGSLDKIYKAFAEYKQARKHSLRAFSIEGKPVPTWVRGFHHRQADAAFILLPSTLALVRECWQMCRLDV